MRVNEPKNTFEEFVTIKQMETIDVRIAHNCKSRALKYYELRSAKQVAYTSYGHMPVKRLVL